MRKTGLCPILALTMPTELGEKTTSESAADSWAYFGREMAMGLEECDEEAEMGKEGADERRRKRKRRKWREFVKR